MPATKCLIEQRENSRKELIKLTQNQVTTDRSNFLEISISSSNSSENTDSDESDYGPLSHRNYIIGAGAINESFDEKKVEDQD